MALGVDISDRKPRKAKGTPLYKLRNRFALGVLSVSVTIGSLLLFYPKVKFRDNLLEYFMHESEEQAERKAIMGLGPYKSSKKIQDMYEESQRIDIPEV